MSKMYQHTMTLQLIIETVSSKCVMEMCVQIVSTHMTLQLITETVSKCVMEMCIQNVSTHNDIATIHTDSAWW